MPKCKTCKQPFEPRVFLQKNCMEKDECINAELEYKKGLAKKSWRKEKKVIKDKMKTKGDYLKELQTIFNKFIRLRDEGNYCISCCKPPKKKNAGHYKSVGASPELRFEELNVYLQCEHCNTFLHGNLINYRVNLIKKIGVEKVDWLERNHEPKHYSIEEIKELKEVYKLKIKQYE